MRRTLILSALLTAARRDAPTGEGEPDPAKLTEAEWEAKRKGELAQRTHDQLVSKQIELERDLKKARERAAPEGAVVLQADDAKEWEALRALGSSKDLKTRLDKGDAAVTTLAGRERSDLVREVADAAGLKFSVLQKLADQDQVTFEIGAEVEKDGKKTRPVMVKTADGKTAPLSEYVTTTWADFAPSLQAGQTATQEKKPVVVGGAGAPQTKPADDALASKRQDTRYSM